MKKFTLIFTAVAVGYFSVGCSSFKPDVYQLSNGQFYFLDEQCQTMDTADSKKIACYDGDKKFTGYREPLTIEQAIAFRKQKLAQEEQERQQMLRLANALAGFSQSVTESTNRSNDEWRKNQAVMMQSHREALDALSPKQAKCTTAGSQTYCEIY